jgi:phenylalanyl-tRNA synthetase beta chain
LGRAALVNERTLINFGIKKAAVVAELSVDTICENAKSVQSYQPIAKFPAIELDLSMEIDNVVTFAEVANVASDAGAPLIERVKFLSVYQGDKLPEGKKALAIRIIYRDLNKTMELSEAQTAHDKVVVELKKSYNINVR